MRRFAPLALLLMISAQPAPEAQVDWRWERDTPICSLKQVVSVDGTTIQISRTPGNDQTSVSVAGRDGSMSVASVILRDGKILFVPGGETSDGTIYLTKRNGSGDVYALIDDTNFLSNIGRSSAIEFKHEKIAPIRLPVRSGAAAVSALRSCEDRTMREWGIDPVAWRALKARPLPLQPWTEWLSGDDYPATAVLNGIEGFVIPKMQVGADGSVLSCESIRRTRSATYRDKMCDKLKKRAHFRPALDANGNPVAAPFVFAIKFRLE